MIKRGLFKKNDIVKLGVLGLTFLTLFLGVQSIHAVPATFDWGTYDAAGSTLFGVYESDNSTILQTADIVQFIWAGPDASINPPLSNGNPTGDDVILDTSIVQNGSGPPPVRNKGYVFLKTYSYNTTDPENNGVVYMRVWNDSLIANATAYGDSGTGTLTAGGSFNAPRWRMTFTPSAVTLSKINGHMSKLNPAWLLAITFQLVVTTLSLLGRFRTQKAQKRVASTPNQKFRPTMRNSKH
jgi:hypothetical protein